jgi:hypothetical protein
MRRIVHLLCGFCAAFALQNGVTALLAATCGCHSAVVKTLLERGANINCVEQVSRRHPITQLYGRSHIIMVTQFVANMFLAARALCAIHGSRDRGRSHCGGPSELSAGLVDRGDGRLALSIRCLA